MITGAVKAPDGSFLPSASVTIINRETSERTPVVTGADGVFRAAVSRGRFDLRVELDGFEQTLVADVPAESAHTVVPDIVMALGTYEEQLEVVAAAPRSTVSTATLGEASGRDVGEAIASVAGLSMVRKGGIANDVVLRGYQGENLTVLIDGARLHGACPSNMDPPAFHADLAEVERVDVGRGPFDMRSQGSLGGVLNIVTARPQRGFHAQLNFTAGSASYVNPSGTLSFGTGPVTALGGFSFRTGSPYRDGGGRPFTTLANYASDARDSSAFDVGTGWTRAYASPAAGKSLHVAYTRQQADHVLYPYLMMDGITDTANRLNGSFEVAAPGRRIDSVSLQAYYSRVRHYMTDQYRTSAAGTPLGFSMGTDASTDTAGGRIVVAAREWQVGVEVYRRAWATEGRTAKSGVYQTQHALPNVSIVSAGGYAESAHAFGRSKLEFGGRADWTASQADGALANLLLYEAYAGTTSTERTDVYPSGKVRYVFAASDALTLEAGVAHAVRTPDPQERYYAAARMGSDWVGDPMLDPSRNTELAATVRVSRGRLRGDVTGYSDYVRNFVTVTSIRLGAPFPGLMNRQARSFANVDARLRGAEGSIDYAIGTRWFASTSISYTRGTKTPRPERGILAPDLAEIPPLSARTSLRFDRGAWFAEATAAFAAAQNHIDVDLKETATPGYAIGGLRAGLRVSHLRVSGSVDNLFNADYAAHLSYQRDPYRAGVIVHEPGRTISVRTSLVW